MLINVTEFGTRRVVSIMSTQILHVETLKYNTGEQVTVVTMCKENNQTIHVYESVEYFQTLLGRY